MLEFCVHQLVASSMRISGSNSSRFQRKPKKRLEVRKHCTLAVVRRSQNFLPRRRPLPGGTGRPKFNQLEMVTTFTYKPSLVRIDAHAILSYRGNRATPPARLPQTGAITIQCAAA